MSNRLFDILDARYQRDAARDAKEAYGRALPRTDLMDNEVAFLARSFELCRWQQAVAQDWVDCGAVSNSHRASP